LWVELVRAERDRYHDPKRGGPDPGAGFEEYLTRLDLTGLWVAEHDDESVVGLIGLVLGPGRSGAVGPIVVADRLRGRGIGRALLDHVSQEARRRGMAYLSVTPASRNEEAIRSFHAAGYHALASVTLALDLTPRDYEWRDGVDLHGLRFSY
jgi:GNAT superfamily N-acetyltransferase